MNTSRSASRIFATAIAALLCTSIVSTTCRGDEKGTQGLIFQKPSQTALGSRAEPSNLEFKSPSAKRSPTKTKQVQTDSEIELAGYEAQALPLTNDSGQPIQSRRRQQAPEPVQFARAQKPIRRDPRLATVVDEYIEPVPEPEMYYDSPMGYDGCDACMGDCACEVSCGIGEPGCGFADPGCGCAEPGCGICEPGCGCAEPGCGICEPGCGVGTPGCGSCVGIPGPDYWCFPVCLPRFKDLSFWGGVHGFRGPRDFSDGRSDSNFGFHEGVSISGRAPFVGLLFPQLSYQLGYQAVHSRLSGTVDTADERTQQFVTAGFFRRVKTGLQFGVVWDLMRDDLDMEVDYHQIRTEFSLKSPQGREIGIWTATSTNNNEMMNVVYETVDQYAIFYRWNFGNNYECRIWAGASGEDEGILGAEIFAPLSDRWTVQSGFNYLIPEEDAGPEGVREEAWNVGINLVWHIGRTAKRGCNSPFRPLFAVADNGWMILDNSTTMTP